jgi:hypothetical protein
MPGIARAAAPVKSFLREKRFCMIVVSKGAENVVRSPAIDALCSQGACTRRHQNRHWEAHDVILSHSLKVNVPPKGLRFFFGVPFERRFSASATAGCFSKRTRAQIPRRLCDAYSGK